MIGGCPSGGTQSSHMLFVMNPTGSCTGQPTSSPEPRQRKPVNLVRPEAEPSLGMWATSSSPASAWGFSSELGGRPARAGVSGVASQVLRLPQTLVASACPRATPESWWPVSVSPGTPNRVRQVQQLSIPQDLLTEFDHRVVLFPDGSEACVPAELRAPSTGCPVQGPQVLAVKCSPRHRCQRGATRSGVASEAAACARS